MSYDKEYEEWKKKRSGGSYEDEYTEWQMKNRGDEIASGINSLYDKWINDYNGIYKDYSSRYSGSDNPSYRSDSAEWLDNITSRMNSNRQMAENLKGYIDRYGKYLGDDMVRNFNKTYSDIGGYRSDMLKAATADNKYWTQWKNEDEYNKAVNDQKKKDEYLSFELEKGKKEIDVLKSYLTLLDNGEYNASTEKAIQSFMNGRGYKSVDDLEAAIAEKETYYKEAERMQSGMKMAKYAENDTDFASLSSEGAKYENPEFDDAAGGIFGIGSKDVKNKVHFVFDNKDKIYMASARAMANSGNLSIKGLEEFGDGNWTNLILHMNDDEIKVYDYYVGKGNTEEADKYLKSLQETLTSRVAGALYEGMEGNTALELAFGMAAGLEQFGSGIKNIFNTDDDYIVPSAAAMASEMVRKDLADDGFNFLGSSIGQVGYDAITTIANMLPSMAISYITSGIASGIGISADIASKVGQIAGTATLGASAGGNYYAEMLNSGMNKNQAKAISIVKGVWEGVSEYYLGAIEGLGANKIGKAIGKTALVKGLEKAGNGVVKGIISFFGDMAIEGLEEVIQDIGESVIDGIATGKWEFSNLEEQVYNFTLGSLTAGAMNVGPATIKRIVNKFAENKYNESMYGDVQNELVAEGLASPEGTFSHKIATAYRKKINKGKNLSGKQLGRLVKANDKAIEQENKQSSANTEAADTNTANRTADTVGTINKDYYDSAIDKATVSNDTSLENIVDLDALIELETRREKETSETVNDDGKINIATEALDSVAETAAQSDTSREALTEAIKSISNKNIAKAELDLIEAEYDGSIPANDYVKCMIEGYNFGYSSVPESAIGNKGYYASLTDMQKKHAYALGYNAVKAKAEAKDAEIKNGFNGNTGRRIGTVKGEGVSINDLKSTFNDTQNTAYKALCTIAAATGIDIVLYRSYVNSNGKYEEKQGKFVYKENTIYIDINSGLLKEKDAYDLGKYTMLRTFCHEFVHFIENGIRLSTTLLERLCLMSLTIGILT